MTLFNSFYTVNFTPNLANIKSSHYKNINSAKTAKYALFSSGKKVAWYE